MTTWRKRRRSRAQRRVKSLRTRWGVRAPVAGCLWEEGRGSEDSRGLCGCRVGCGTGHWLDHIVFGGSFKRVNGTDGRVPGGDVRRNPQPAWRSRQGTESSRLPRVSLRQRKGSYVVRAMTRTNQATGHTTAFSLAHAECTRPNPRVHVRRHASLQSRVVQVRGPIGRCRRSASANPIPRGSVLSVCALLALREKRRSSVSPTPRFRPRHGRA